MKINSKALIERMKPEFLDNIDSDIEEGELYAYTEDDLLPNLSEYKDKINASRKINEVKMKQLIFNDHSIQIIFDIAKQANIDNHELFTKQLQAHVNFELGRLKFQKENRNLAQCNSAIKNELTIFNSRVSGIVNKFITMNSDTRSFVMNNMQLGIPLIFNGKLNDFSENDLLKFLHLLETSSQCHDQDIIDYSRTTKPIIFIQRVLLTWESFVPQTNLRGMKALLDKLFSELYNSMNQPIPDLKYWFKHAKEGK